MCIQLPDNLILNGRNVAIEPLPILENDSIISVPENAMPITTAHQRGYVADWELTPQGLFLAKVEGCYQLNNSEPLFADWVNAVILPADGTYGESFEISIEKGLVLKD